MFEEAAVSAFLQCHLPSQCLSFHLIDVCFFSWLTGLWLGSPWFSVCSFKFTLNTDVNIFLSEYASFAIGSQTKQSDFPHERITFHSQRMNHLSVHLTEVDPFGNYSSPHYKGTAEFYKVSRAELEWRGDAAVPKDLKLLGDPVCKLSLTLPKVSKHSQSKSKFTPDVEKLRPSTMEGRSFLHVSLLFHLRRWGALVVPSQPEWSYVQRQVGEVPFINHTCMHT